MIETERFTSRELDSEIKAATRLFSRGGLEEKHGNGDIHHYERVARTLHDFGFNKHIVLGGLYHGIPSQHLDSIKNLTQYSRSILDGLAAFRIRRKNIKPEEQELNAFEPILSSHPRAVDIAVIRSIERLDTLQHVQLTPAQNRTIAKVLRSSWAKVMYQLGYYDIARRLHEAAYRELYPDATRKLEEEIKKAREKYESEGIDYAEHIRKELEKKGIQARVFARPTVTKELGSCLEKADRKGMPLHQLPPDFIGFTVIPNDVSLVETTEPPQPPENASENGLKKFEGERKKRYDKTNDFWLRLLGAIGNVELDRNFYQNPRGPYKAIHFDVKPKTRGKITMPFELQIKTLGAYDEAERQTTSGAARTVYKSKGLDEATRAILQRAVKPGREESIITIRTRDGKTILLPGNATPLDLAFHPEMVEEFGNRTASAVVWEGDKQRRISLYSRLKDGQRIYLTSDKTGKGFSPNLSWLNTTTTDAAREAITQKLGNSGKRRQK